MRKRVTVAVLVVLIVACVLVYVRPRDSVEYHISAYRRAKHKLTNETFLDELRDLGHKLRSNGIGRQRRLRMAMKEHREALVRLGYLEERTFTFTNAAPPGLGPAVQQAVMKKGTNWEFFNAIVGTGMVRVVTVKGMMPGWDDIVNQLPVLKEN